MLRNVSGEGIGTGVGLLVDGGIAPGPTPGYSTDIEVDGYRFWGVNSNPSGLPVVAVWAVPGTTDSNGLANIQMNMGDAEVCSAGSPLMDINGFSATTGSGSIDGVSGNTLDLEAKSSGAYCNGLHIMDAHKVEMLNINAEAPGTELGPVADNNMAAAVYINESNPALQHRYTSPVLTRTGPQPFWTGWARRRSRLWQRTLPCLAALS